MSGLVVDHNTGLPKQRDSVYQQFFQTIGAGQTVVIDTLPLVEFDLMTYELAFFGPTQDDVKSLSMRVQQFSGSLREQVFGKMGNLAISLDTAINGSAFELRATNSETFSVGVCLTVLTT